MLVILCSCTSIIILFTYFTYLYVLCYKFFRGALNPIPVGIFEEDGGKIAPTLTSDKEKLDSKD